MYDVYFAAPLSKQEDAERNIEVVKKLREAGLTVFLPQEIGRVVDSITDDKDKIRHEYFQEDIAALDCSKTILMYLGREPSAGACWELGYAYAKHMPRIGFLEYDDYELGTFLSQSAIWMYTVEGTISMIKAYTEEPENESSSLI
jgi:nucleoside 2-deoxyribosyltransferase